MDFKARILKTVDGYTLYLLKDEGGYASLTADIETDEYADDAAIVGLIADRSEEGSKSFFLEIKTPFDLADFLGRAKEFMEKK